MQKVYFLLIFLLSLTFVPKVEASHMIGGEISWKCSSEKYVFFMQVYRDCSAIQWGYENETIEIFGSPLPKDTSDNDISSITMMPDSVKWRANNNGDASPTCNPTGNEPSISCAARNNGSVQVFYYQSEPIDMSGTPPETGWRFTYESECCRPNVTNLSTGGVMILRAMMYPDKNGTDVKGCIDNSPEFRALPVNSVCKGYLFTYNQTAIDRDLDSIVYAWDRTYNIPHFNPIPVPYATGYNFNSPTPGPSFNAKNIAATLDPNAGIMRMAIYSGGTAGRYLIVVRADGYRDGKRIASVFREIPYYVFDCPPIDSITPNNQPQFYFDNAKQKKYEIVVEAGEKVEFPVQLMDYDSSATGIPQELTLSTFGNQFAADFMDTSNCANPPCAILKNNVPQYDSSRNRSQLSDSTIVSTDFEWQTNCDHISADGSQKTYYFYFSAKDDHCPIPQQVDTYVKVIVGSEGVKSVPQLDCVIDSGNTHWIAWSADQDLANNFSQWYIYAGDTLGKLELIDSISNFNTKSYHDNQRHTYYQVKTKLIMRIKGWILTNQC